MSIIEFGFYTFGSIITKMYAEKLFIAIYVLFYDDNSKQY